jgi:hypothetical protein
MRKIFILVYVLVLNVYSADQSGLSIVAGTSDNPSKIQLRIIDSEERITGFQDFGYDEDGYKMINSIREIPETGYTTESQNIVDPETNEIVGGMAESINFGMDRIFKDTYTIQVIGLSNTTYFLQLSGDNFNGEKMLSFSENTYYSLISSGSVHEFYVFLDPTPGAPAPTITKSVTFQTLRDDLKVAQKLNQVGDDKFVKSLLSMINISEKLSNRCDKQSGKHKVEGIINATQNKNDNKKELKQDICYKPAIAILRMFVKRLEIANKLCDLPKDCKSKCKKPADCDEENEWAIFSKKHIKDKDYKEFFEEWEKYECHKDKKMCKRFVTDNSLGIISDDVNWLIKSFGDDIWEYYKKEENPYIYPRSKVLFK